MADLSSAGYRLGAAFGGGGRFFDDAKSREEKRLIERAQLQAETDRKVDLAIEESKKRAAIEAISSDPSIPTRDKNLILGALGTQYSAVQQGNLRGQELGFRGDAVSAALAGNLNDANANLFGVARGPVDIAKIQDHTVINPTVVGGGDLRTTEIGDSVATANYASANQRNAAANLSATKAAAGGFAPRTAGAGGRGGKRSEPPQHLLSAYFGNDKGVIDRGKLKEFEQWRSEHPEITNGVDALVEFEQRPAPWETIPHGTMTVVPGHAPVVRELPAVSDAFAARDPGTTRETVEAEVPRAQNGPGFQVPVPGNPPVTAKVPGVPETDGPIQAAPAWEDVRNTKSGRLLQEARAAVAAGAPVESVRARLRAAGYKNIASRL